MLHLALLALFAGGMSLFLVGGVVTSSPLLAVAGVAVAVAALVAGLVLDRRGGPHPRDLRSPLETIPDRVTMTAAVHLHLEMVRPEYLDTMTEWVLGILHEIPATPGFAPIPMREARFDCDWLNCAVVERVSSVTIEVELALGRGGEDGDRVRLRLLVSNGEDPSISVEDISLSS